MDNKKQFPYLHTPKGQPVWEWWAEDPIEIIVVMALLIAFFTVPRDGCGVSSLADPGMPVSAATAVHK